MVGGILLTARLLGYDQQLLEMTGIRLQGNTISRLIFDGVLATSGFWGWSFLRVCSKSHLKRRLKQVLTNSGLTNALGKTPRFLSDRPLDSSTRILRLTNANLPLTKFEGAKSAIESGLQIYVDLIRESRQFGTVDIVYAQAPMPSMIPFMDDSFSVNRVKIGHTRGEPIYAELDKVPHFLIAGQTGGGKSTMIRQMITSLYLGKGNIPVEFTLVDLKGGLEFQSFEELKGVKVVSSLVDTVSILTDLASELDDRMAVLKANHCKDLAAYRKIAPDDRKNVNGNPIGTYFDRHIFVIDEASELFLSGAGESLKTIQGAKRAVSRIARMGRAVGINLIVGTQRPDARALDTQIKANLPGKICFQMGDTASSMVVLSNKRARDLPNVPGRAIYQNGSRQMEVQVPFLDVNKAEALLHGKESDKE
jgi:S-DNA-T family DNA segregation ATPase FtsK/SpoIIIE